MALSMPALAIPRPREMTQCSRGCPPHRGWEGTGTPVLQVESGRGGAAHGKQAAL